MKIRFVVESGMAKINIEFDDGNPFCTLTKRQVETLVKFFPKHATIDVKLFDDGGVVANLAHNQTFNDFRVVEVERNGKISWEG
jgi:hypothetical protein